MSQSNRRSNRPPNQHPSRLVFRPPESKQEREARLRAAREKAAEYLNPPEENEPDENEQRTIEAWSDLVSQRIEEAMRRGDFDNLAGEGKPVDTSGDPFIPEDQQMAFKLLRNNDLKPGWIADRQAVLMAIEEFREDMALVAGEAHQAWILAKDAPRRVQVLNRWDYWLERWEEELKEVNKQINDLNLKQPINHLEIFKLRLDDELRRIGMTRQLRD